MLRLVEGMTRDSAVKLVGKLREVRVDRGATPAEASLAASKADRLVRRFGLDRREAHPPPRREKRPVFTAGTEGPAWAFDMSTGVASGNVKVHRYQNRGNWKIEVPFDGSLRGVL